MLISCCPVCVAEHAAAVCKTYQDKADTLRTEFIRRSMRCKFIPVSILTTAVLYYTFLCFACCFVLILAHSDLNVSHFVHVKAASMQGYLYAAKLIFPISSISFFHSRLKAHPFHQIFPNFLLPFSFRIGLTWLTRTQAMYHIHKLAYSQILIAL